MFEQQAYLPWCIAGCLLGVVLCFLHARSRAGSRRRFAPAGPSRRLCFSRGHVLTVCGLALLLLSLAGPVWGRAPRLVYIDGEDLLFVIDTSLSMTCDDVSPSRLKSAGFLALNLIRELAPARFGLVAYAGSAVPLSPLTFDAPHVQGLIGGLYPRRMPVAGTSADHLFRTLSTLLSKPDPDRRLTVLLVGDGEFFDQPGPESLEKLRRSGARLVVVGIGSPNGTAIPDPRAERPAPLTDEAGRPIVSRLSEPTLQELAAQAGGSYLAFQSVGETTDQIVQRFFQERTPSRYSYQEAPVSRRRDFAWAAWALFAAALVLGERRSAFRVRRLLPWLGLPALLGCTSTMVVQTREANALARQGRHAEAAARFSRLLGEADPSTPAYPALGANLSDALLRTRKPRESATAALQTLRSGRSPEHRESVLYNLGCAQLATGNRFHAAESFRLALETDPGLPDAAWNLELALRDTPPPPPAQPPPPPPPGKGGGSPPPPAGENRVSEESARKVLDSIKGRESPPPPRPQPTPSDRPSGPYW
ncbi:MAG: VWA domain-containing protein [Acidobacteria bacterium]|nr:VWA domain-containing protein [Acidobacteriota bacterium]